MLNQKKTVWTAAPLLGFALLCGANAPTMAAANFVLVITDSSGEGFNDTTPVAAVPGNPATTLGQQRQNVFLAAMQVWGATLDSSVDIRVDAQFNPLFCSEFSAVLGSAGPQTAHINFVGAVPGIWYAQALANSIAGSDLSGFNDINATFNSDLDLGNADCLQGNGWNYEIPAAGTSLSLYSVVLHELAHGLNILTLADRSTGALFNGSPDIFTTFLFDQGTGEAWTDMTNAERAASAIGGDLYWMGANAKIAGIGVPLTAGQPAATQFVEMYAPNPLEQGSSVSHFDTGLTPDELMEPFSTPVPLREVTTGAFVDMGWNAEYDGCGVDYVLNTDWRQIALPCVPATATVRAVFGDDLGEGDYNSRWVLYEWDPDTGAYVRPGLDDTLSQGTGYWIRTLDGGTIDIDGTATPLSTASPCPDTLNGCFAIPLGTADVYHMVAHTLPYSVDWRDVRFVSGGVANTPQAAELAGWAYSFFYRYNGSGYDIVDDLTNPDTLDSHDGIWVRTMAGAPADLQLFIPASGANTPGAP